MSCGIIAESRGIGRPQASSIITSYRAAGDGGPSRLRNAGATTNALARGRSRRRGHAVSTVGGPQAGMRGRDHRRRATRWPRLCERRRVNARLIFSWGAAFERLVWRKAMDSIRPRPRCGFATATAPRSRIARASARPGDPPAASSAAMERAAATIRRYRRERFIPAANSP